MKPTCFHQNNRSIFNGPFYHCDDCGRIFVRVILEKVDDGLMITAGWKCAFHALQKEGTIEISDGETTLILTKEQDESILANDHLGKKVNLRLP